jgi:hypothetical protein
MDGESDRYRFFIRLVGQILWTAIVVFAINAGITAALRKVMMEYASKTGHEAPGFWGLFLKCLPVGVVLGIARRVTQSWRG